MYLYSSEIVINAEKQEAVEFAWHFKYKGKVYDVAAQITEIEDKDDKFFELMLSSIYASIEKFKKEN